MKTTFWAHRHPRMFTGLVFRPPSKTCFVTQICLRARINAIGIGQFNKTRSWVHRFHQHLLCKQKTPHMSQLWETAICAFFQVFCYFLKYVRPCIGVNRERRDFFPSFFDCIFVKILHAHSSKIHIKIHCYVYMWMLPYAMKLWLIT